MSEIASAYVRVRPEMSGFKQETEAGVKKGFGGVPKLIAGLGLGVAVVSAFKSGFQELAQSQKVAAQTNAVIKSTGAVANVSAREVSTFADAMLRKTGIDDEATKSAENMLLTFTKVRNESGKGNDIFNQGAAAILNLDAAMTHGNSTAESLRSKSILVGKALNDPVKGMVALRRVGILLDEQQQKTVKSLVAQGKTMDAQKIIIRELNTEFGGSAAAIGNTLPGKLNILRETWRNDMAALLSSAAPTLTKIIGWVTVALPVGFKALGLVVHAVAGQVRGALEAVQPALEPIMNTVSEFVKTVKDEGIGAAFSNLKDTLMNMSGPAKIAAVALGAVAVAILAVTAPISSLVALGVALDVLYQKNAAFRDFVNQAWAQIKAIVTGVVTFLQNLWTQYGDSILAGARATYTALAAIVSQALNWIKGFWQRNGAEISQYAKIALDDLKTIIRAGLAFIRAFWDRFGKDIVTIVRADLNMVKGVIQGVITVIKNIIKLGLDLIHGNWSAAWNDLVGVVRGAFGIVSSVLRGYAKIVFTLAKAIGSAILSGILSILTFIGLKIVGALKGIGDAIMAAAKSAYTLALEIGKKIVDGIVDGVKSLPGRLGNALKGGITGAYHFAGGFMHGSGEFMSSKHVIGEPIAQGIIEGFLNGIQGLKPAMTKSIGDAVNGTSAAAKKLSSGTQSSIAAIVQAASRYGVDPAAMIAIAMHESGLRANAVGDNGSSFGLFQLHKGGALGSMSPAAAMNALTNALVAAKALAGLGGKGLSGERAVSLLSRGFERPADPAGEIADAMRHYQEALSYVGSTSASVARTLKTAAAMSATALIRMQPAILRDRALGNSLLPTIGATIGDLAKSAAKTQNIGAAAKVYLQQEETLLEVAYATLKADLAHAKGKARAPIEAAMEQIHRKIGRVIDAIADAVIVTGDALLPDKLRAQLRGLTSRFKAETAMAAVQTGDAVARYQAELNANLRDQRAVLMHEIDALKAKLEHAKGRQKAAIRAELAKVSGQFGQINQDILSSLTSMLQATQGRVSNLFGSVKAAMDAQFDAQTQKMLAALGKQFFQGSLTPEEARLQAYQTAKSQKALSDALDTARSELAQALSQPLVDPVEIAQKRAALAAAEEAIALDKMQAAATASRIKADQDYAAASAKLQADRAALEQQMNDQLDALIESILNGTGSISDLNAIAAKYGVTIDTKTIPQMKDLASATKTLAAEFRKLEALIRRLTGSKGTVAGPSSSITQAEAFQTVLDNAFRAALAGETHIGGLASGGLVKARPGGTILRIAEGGEDELVIPAGRAAAAQARSARTIVEALAPLTTLEAMHRTSIEMRDELRKQTAVLEACPPGASGGDANLSAVRAKR